MRVSEDNVRGNLDWCINNRRCYGLLGTGSSRATHIRLISVALRWIGAVEVGGRDDELWSLSMEFLLSERLPISQLQVQSSVVKRNMLEHLDVMLSSRESRDEIGEELHVSRVREWYAIVDVCWVGKPYISSFWQFPINFC